MSMLQEIRVPQESVNDDRLLVLELLVEQGAQVSEGTSLIELETSKTTFTIEAEVDGYVHFLCKVGEEVQIDTVIIQIHETVIQETSPVVPTSVSTPQAVMAAQVNGKAEMKPTVIVDGAPVFSLSAKKLLEQHAIQESSFAGKDFVGKRDVMAFLNPNESAFVEQEAKVQKAPTPAVPLSEKFEVIPLSSAKKREIAYLSHVQQHGLTSMVHVRVNTNGLLETVAKEFKVMKTSLLPLITFESSKLLRKYPDFNSFFNQDHIARYRDVNIGIAIDMEKGLKVLKIPQTDQLAISEIESQIIELSEVYLEDKIKPAQLSDITFTITDLSNEGVSGFSPLVNMQNGAILGVSAIESDVQKMTLTLTFDHRITAGKQAANWLSELKSRLESYGPSPNQSQPAYVPDKVRCDKCFKKLSSEFSGIGFVKGVNLAGEEVFYCQSCLAGF